MRRGDDDSRLLLGDAHAFAAFYRRHEDAVLGYFLERTRRADVAADLTAEAFARALAGRDRFDARRGDAAAWLFGIAHHLLATSLELGRVEDDARRRLGMEPLVLGDDALARIEALGDEPASRALAALPADQREAVVGRKRRRRAWRVPLLAGAGTLAVAGAAAAAAGLLKTGEPVPRAPAPPAAGLAAIDPGSRALLPLRAADPAGGLPWGVRIDRRADGKVFCAQVGRVQDGTLGVVGRDGAFHDDGRFHPLPDDADQGQICAGAAPDGQLYSASSGPAVPASGYTGTVGGRVGGCREDVPASSMSAATRARLKDVPVCAADSLRIVRFEFAGRAATRVEFGTATEVPDPQTSGAYLFVLPATAHGAVLTVTYKDGTVCRDGAPPTPQCFPPPGFHSHR